MATKKAAKNRSKKSPLARGREMPKTRLARGREMPKTRFPAHLRVGTPEEWRALKRTEWREVAQALERYNYGSAYTPAHSALYNLQRLAQQITQAIDADGWIAW